MVKASRYWDYSKKKDEAAPLLRNSPEPFHAVTHRAIGDIPGCIPAVETFIERSSSEVHDYLMASAERYCHDMRTMAFQEFVNAPLERALPAFK